MFDFPNTPTTGQQFTPAGGPTYQWNGTGWTLLGAPSAAPGSGNLVLLSTQTVSTAVASVNFTGVFTSTYTDYVLRLRGLRLASAAPVQMRLSSNGGSTWISTGYYFGSQEADSSGTGANGGVSNAAQFGLNTANQDGTANMGSPFNVEIFAPGSTTLYKYVMGQGLTTQTTTVYRGFMGGYLNTLSACDSVQILSTVNIAAGTFQLFGVVP